MHRFARPLVSALAPAVLAASAWVSPAAVAEPVEFNLQDPKGVNGVVFVLDSKLEPITGLLGGVGGTVSYDPAEPTSLDGHITVDVASIAFVSGGMTATLKGADWLNISDKFIATLEIDEATSATAGGGEGEQDVTVNATMKFGGKEVPLTLTIGVTHLPEAAQERGGAQSGDLLVLRSTFEVDRKDLGIQEGMGFDTVGQTITVMAPIVGYSK
ncbi:MAG: YceI family protein [Planctomycetota bacterium]